MLGLVLRSRVSRRLVLLVRRRMPCVRNVDTVVGRMLLRRVNVSLSRVTARICVVHGSLGMGVRIRGVERVRRDVVRCRRNRLWVCI